MRNGEYVQLVGRLQGGGTRESHTPLVPINVLGLVIGRELGCWTFGLEHVGDKARLLNT